jgi:hypothetical protein
MDEFFEAPPADEDVTLDPPRRMAAVRRARRSAAPTGAFFEYLAPDGKAWRCDVPDKLFGDFGISGDADTRRDELTRLHCDVGPVRESWDVIRRVYRLAPVIGATKEELREWSIEEIAREAGVPVKRIESIIEETKVFWARKCNERSLVTRAVEGPSRCIGATVEALGDLDDEQIAKLLSKHGFEEVPPNYQRYMARRIVEFQHLLDDEQGSHLARSALMQELILLEYDREIRRMLQKDGAGRSQKALDDLVQRRSSLQSTYENTLERLGATQEQNPGYRAKVAFGDSLGHLAKAMQEYYADGNNALVDGLFTAAEIKLLVTPTSLRPAQYRPDLPMLVEQWRANFWNPEWEGAKLPREMHRFFLATFKKASEEFTEGKVAEMDGGEVEAGDVEMAVAEGGMDAPAITATGAASADFAVPAPSTVAPTGNSRAPRADKDFAGWVS